MWIALGNYPLALFYQKHTLFVIAAFMKTGGDAKFRTNWIGNNTVSIFWRMIIFYSNFFAYTNYIVTSIPIWLAIGASISTKM